MSALSNVKRYLILTIGIVMMFSGCNPDDECSDPTTIDIPFQGFGTRVDGDSCILRNINENQTDVILVIGNSVDLQRYVSCIGNLEINFNESFLLAGRTKRPACAFMKNQTLSLKCNQLHYAIEIEDMLCHAPTDVFYFAIVSREYYKYPVTLSVTIAKN